MSERIRTQKESVVDPDCSSESCPADHGAHAWHLVGVVYLELGGLVICGKYLMLKQEPALTTAWYRLTCVGAPGC